MNEYIKQGFKAAKIYDMIQNTTESREKCFISQIPTYSAYSDEVKERFHAKFDEALLHFYKNGSLSEEFMDKFNIKLTDEQEELKNRKNNRIGDNYKSVNSRRGIHVNHKKRLVMDTLYLKRIKSEQELKAAENKRLKKQMKEVEKQKIAIAVEINNRVWQKKYDKLKSKHAKKIEKKDEQIQTLSNEIQVLKKAKKAKKQALKNSNQNSMPKRKKRKTVNMEEIVDDNNNQNTMSYNQEIIGNNIYIYNNRAENKQK